MGPEADIHVVPATADRWADIVAVFGTRGDPARCWCQWFFDGSQIGFGEVAAANRAALKAQMREAPAPGVLAYDGEQPAGWCAVAPRPCYGRLRRGPLLRGTDPAELADDAVWSVTCFVVKVGHRRRGIAAALLRGAVAHAGASGASVVEGYPVDVAGSGSSSASLYHGPLSTFLGAGFAEVTHPTARRAVVRLVL
ncbi:MAG TPA: GNAT family N-acetyltransferase [Euzebya sp.]|nr:GNAT family N-acetyltransferase [Euzebya sp.]